MILVDRAGRAARLWRGATRPRAALAVGGLAAVAVVAVLLTAPHAGPKNDGPAPRAQAVDNTATRSLGAAASASVQPPGGAVVRSLEAIEDALYVRGSLRDTVPDGGWALDDVGALRPDIRVRRRFDQLLTTLGEASAEELGRLLRAQAARQLPPRAVDQLMDLWQSYLRLQGHAYKLNAAFDDPGRWQAALDERVRVRRQWLGAAWAEAFYRDEELAVRAQIASRLATPSAADLANPSATEGLLPDAARRPQAGADLAALQRQRVAAFGTEAAERLAQEDAAQQQWEQRVAEARQRTNALQTAPELSPAQRTDAIERFLATEFDATERLRVRALLKLADPS